MQGHRIGAIVGLSVLALTSAAFGRQSDKPVVVHTVDYIAAPPTLAQLWNAVDAVARIRIESSEVRRFDRTGNPDYPRVATVHTARLLEVLKPYASLIPGQTVQVVQSAGELDIGSKIVRVNGGYQPFGKGEEYALFLEWNTGVGEFEVAYGPAATFLLANGTVTSPARNGPALELRGMPVDSFLTLLRSLAR
jgi:hypothetical protein